MRVVIQRVSKSEVTVSNSIVGSIKSGLLIFVSFINNYSSDDLIWMTNKILKLRIFNDENNKMNKSILDISGEIMIISQFTLHSSTKKGSRPSFIKSANHQIANELYLNFINLIESKFGKKVQTGEFGSYMKVDLSNDGPTTIIMDSKLKE